MARLEQGGQGRDGEIGRAEEGEAHEQLIARQASARAAFLTFDTARSRFRRER